MSDIANINAVVGRSFVSSSGNVATVSRLGEGGIRAGWRKNPTGMDIQEFTAWMEAILGPLELEIHLAGKASEGATAKARAAFAEWQRKQRK